MEDFAQFLVGREGFAATDADGDGYVGGAVGKAEDGVVVKLDEVGEGVCRSSPQLFGETQ